MTHIIADSSLSESEKDDKATRRILPSGRKPHPKKKHDTGRASPRPYQRKIRVNPEDLDTRHEAKDKDLSLSNNFSFSMPDIALRIAIKQKIPYSKNPDIKGTTTETLKSFEARYFSSLVGVKKFVCLIGSVSEKLKNEFLYYIINVWSGKSRYVSLNDSYSLVKSLIGQGSNPPSFSGRQVTLMKEYNDHVNGFLKVQNDFNDPKKVTITMSNSNTIFNSISHAWKKANSSRNWGLFVAILKAIENEMDRFDYDDSYKTSLTLDPNNKDFQDFLSLISDDGSMEIEKYIPTQVDNRFQTLAIIYKALVTLGTSVNWEELKKEIKNSIVKFKKDNISERLISQHMRNFFETIDSHDSHDSHDGYKYGEYDKAIKLIDENTKKPRSKTDVDWETVGKKYYKFFKENFPGKIPEHLQHFAFQLSNKKEIIRMYKKASYHGILQQGHPSGPTNTGWNSIDKRYIGDKHYTSILSCAKQLLKENDWFLSNWEGSSLDAPLRAALDLSIATADNSIYQSKIDAPTYEKLLNELAGWKYDTFQDTVLNIPSSPKKREASVVRFASERLQDLTKPEKVKEAADSGELSGIIGALGAIIKGGETVKTDEKTTGQANHYIGVLDGKKPLNDKDCENIASLVKLFIDGNGKK